MTLRELVEEAKAKSPAFKAKVEFWTHKKRKPPDLPWLMEQLETILGRAYVKAAALEQVKEDTSWKTKAKKAVTGFIASSRSSLSRTTRRT